MSKATMVLALITALVGMASVQPAYALEGEDHCIGKEGIVGDDCHGQTCQYYTNAGHTVEALRKTYGCSQCHECNITSVYLKGGVDTNSCPTGFVSIGSVEGCQAAHSSVGAIGGIASENNPDYPKGCYIYSNNMLYVNTHDTGSSEHSARPICVSSSAPTTSPTTMPTTTPEPPPPTPGPTTSPTSSPTLDPTQGPTTTSPTQGPTTTSPTPSPTLDPVSAAAAVYEDTLDHIAAVGCYTDTSAAKLDLKELKSQFESYRMELLKVNRTTLGKRSKKDLKDEFKKKQKTFAAAKRTLRTKKRAAKLDGKRCFWTRNPTPSPTEEPTSPPATSPTPPTTSPTPAPTILELTYNAGDGNFQIDDSGNCTARIEELQTFSYIAGNLYFYGSNQCPSVELSLLKGIGGNLIFEYTVLTTFNAEQLQTIDGFMLVQYNTGLATFNADKLQTIGGRLEVVGNPLMTTFNANKLQTIGGTLQVQEGLETLGLAALPAK